MGEGIIPAVARSMTGYGSGESSGARGRFRAELRGINARFLEVRVRVPPMLGPFEADFRRRIGESFHRGRLDLSLVWESVGEAQAPIKLNAGLARAYLEAAERLRKELLLGGELSLLEVLSLPGVIEIVRAETVDTELRDLALLAVTAAVREADGMRRSEGAALTADIAMRLERLAELKGTVAARADAVPASVQKKLQDRLARLGVDAAVDPARLAQEVAYLADRSDIMEELARLDAHLARCGETLAKADEPVGKTLEFLAQELHREVNTIGSKSSDVEISGCVLRMKTEIERVREQVMNLE